MSTQHRHQLSRLAIPPPFQVQQPMQPMYSPNLPSAIHQGFNPPYNPQSALQTPMQGNFFPPPPGAPGRPMHRAHPSFALAAAGIHPPLGMPMTPLGQGQFSPGMMVGPPFMQRGRRQPSISTGGPPKAQLGGAGKNYRPASPTSTAATAATGTSQKVKKGAVSLPQETKDGERAPWARTPIPEHLLPPQPVVPPLEASSSEIYPPDVWRQLIPDTVDVFLPGKASWEDIKKKVIEEKLEKLGVEKGTGSYSTVPHIHAPHARAASISSPADPALLYFKLNKLQQSQNSSQAQSTSTSPQPPPPPFTSTPPTHSQSALPPRLQNRHGHSLSLAAPPFQPSRSIYNPLASFNPFGPGATLGSDAIDHTDAMSDPGAPTDQSLAPPQMPVRADSRPNFVVGFGLDIPEEEEPEEDSMAEASLMAHAGADETVDMELEGDDDRHGYEETDDGDMGSITTAAQSRMHSRHVSKLSAALSLLSVGGQVPGHEADAEDQDGDGDGEDAVGEWTGSEDLRTGETTEDDESIGEWSNPSDEERARQDRLHRRLMRRSQHQEIQTPRRLPNFPNPPKTTPFDSLTARRRDGDDMVSNPSEEDAHPRPLPSLPGSRPGSVPFSVHDPARAQSRHESEKFVYSGLAPNVQAPVPVPARKDSLSLNPHAKPFVFGASRLSGSWAPGTFGLSSTINSGPSTPGHTRLPSLGKPLNAAAAEFKPGSFTFRPPVDGPKFTFPVPEPAAPLQQPRPLPSPPPNPSPIRASQGREKRQRRGSMDSQASDDSDSVQEAMTSFKFPSESPQKNRSAPPSPGRRAGALNAAARPFTLPGYSSNTMPNNLPMAIKEPVPLAHPVLSPRPPVESPESASDAAPETNEHELPVPPAMKPRRAPIPLDFKHPVSTNTVPAGLFKALANGDDERTRRTVRSRLSSREIFEHVSRPSLDDLNVPLISQNVSRGRMVTDPGRWDVPLQRKDVFTPAVAKHRRSSLPAGSSSSISGESIQPTNISRRLEIQQYEERLEALLDEKIDSLRVELQEQRQTVEGGTMNASTEAMINEVVSLFRTQLQESAAHGLEDSQLDARGELDFQLVKDIVEQGHADARAMIQDDFAELVRRLDYQKAESPAVNMQQLAEEFHTRTRNTIVSAVSQLAARMEGLERTRTPHITPSLDREGIVRDLLASLVPHISAMRSESVDYEELTNQLTQSVKPHISQLIDLASDKRETASLIVDRLIPVLPQIYPPAETIDTSAIIAQITNEVRRIIAPVDTHEIKEQVSDLVVERLDSRLAVRDRVLDGLSSKVTESVGHLLEPVREVAIKVDELAQSQNSLAAQTHGLASIHRDVVRLLAGLPDRLAAATDALSAAQADLLSKGVATVQDISSSETILSLQSTIDVLSGGQQKLASKTEQLLAVHQDILSHLDTFPDGMAVTLKSLQSAQADLLSRSVTKQDFEEVRRMMSTNADLQVQLAKARAQHGAARAERDMLLERVTSSETERDRLRAQVDEIQANMIARATDAATSDARNAELEEALAQSLERLKTSDVTIATQQERIIELDHLNRDLVVEKQNLISKVHTAETQAGYAARDKTAAVDALTALQKEHDALLSQQSHWDDLRRASEQIEQLASLVSQSNEPELRDLRRIRDRSKILESEYAALQRRFKDQENRATSSDRAATTARQSLTQAQQRAAEWEKRAQEYESSLEENQVKLDQVDEKYSQLDADYQLVRMQLDERDAESRLTKDREHKLRDQIAALESKITRLQAENAQARKAPAAHSPPRPDSRASTVYPSRAATPTAMNGRSVSRRTNTPPQSQTSVWDSMHAPTKRYPHLGPTPAPRARGLPAYTRSSIPSPTPSVVSLAPTQGNDGWWE